MEVHCAMATDNTTWAYKKLLVIGALLRKDCFELWGGVAFARHSSGKELEGTLAEALRGAE